MKMQRKITQIDNVRFDKNADSGEITLTKRGPMLKRQINIILNQSQFTINHVTNINRFIDVDKSPQQNYHEFMSFDQTRPTIIAYNNSYNLYIIKKHKCNLDKKTRKAQLFKHNFLIDIQNVFERDAEIHIVYEYMDVSFQHILATFKRFLISSEIAVICKQVRNCILSMCLW